MCIRDRLRTVESDVAPLIIGLTAAYHRALNRQASRSLVETAASFDKPHDDEDDDDDDDDDVEVLIVS